MASKKETVEFIVGQLQGVGDIRTRSMMGEYLLYVDEILVGQINNDKLFIKVTEYGDSVLGESTKASPYPGAKPSFEIPHDKLQDSAWLVDFVHHSKSQLAKT